MLSQRDETVDTETEARMMASSRSEIEILLFLHSMYRQLCYIAAVCFTAAVFPDWRRDPETPKLLVLRPDWSGDFRFFAAAAAAAAAGVI